MYNMIKSICNFKLFNWTDECTKAIDLLFEEYSEIDIYNIYAPHCLMSSNLGVRMRDKLTDSQIKVIHFKVLILDPNFSSKISSSFDLNLTACTCRSPGEQWDSFTVDMTHFLKYTQMNISTSLMFKKLFMQMLQRFLSNGQSASVYLYSNH